MWIKIDGISMLPLLPDGTFARLSLCSVDDLACGDIIVFKLSGRFISHRLINKIRLNKRWYFRTKGDISQKYDGLIEEKQLIGKVIAVKWFNRYVPVNHFLGRFVGLGLTYLSPFLYRFCRLFPNRCR